VHVYKVALRELEGAYPDGAEPSSLGLPVPSKPARPWPKKKQSKKRKLGDGDGDAAEATLPGSVSASECAMMVTKLKAHAEMHRLEYDELWKHGAAIGA